MSGSVSCPFRHSLLTMEMQPMIGRLPIAWFSLGFRCRSLSIEATFALWISETEAISTLPLNLLRCDRNPSNTVGKLEHCGIGHNAKVHDARCRDATCCQVWEGAVRRRSVPHQQNRTACSNRNAHSFPERHWTMTRMPPTTFVVKCNVHGFAMSCGMPTCSVPLTLTFQSGYRK